MTHVSEIDKTLKDESQCVTCIRKKNNFMQCEFYSVNMKNAAIKKGKSCEGYKKPTSR